MHFIKDGLAFSSEMIVNELKGMSPEILKAEEANRFIFNFIEKFLIEHAATVAKASLSVYRQLKVHLEAFEKHRKRRIILAEIDAQFFNSFQNFLIQHRDIANTTMQKQLRTLKTFLGYAKKNKIVIDESYKDFKIKRDSLDVFALTKQEFDALFELDLFDNLRLDKVRDVFCFACATGLRYSDFSNLKREHITESEIVFTHIKTRDYHRIPLNKYSQSILNKYATDRLPLPVISAVNMNLYVKELGKKAGITQPHEKVRYKGANRIPEVEPRYKFITNHVARKTFITLSLELGMNAEEVMALSNHKDYRSFKRYVDITDQRKKLVMSKAWGAIK
jgi:integrase